MIRAPGRIAPTALVIGTTNRQRTARYTDCQWVAEMTSAYADRLRNSIPKRLRIGAAILGGAKGAFLSGSRRLGRIYYTMHCFLFLEYMLLAFRYRIPGPLKEIQYRSALSPRQS